MNRRGFLGAMLAACAAPAIVRADSLMRIIPMDVPVIEVPSGMVMMQEACGEDIPEWMAQQLGERVQLVREMVLYGSLYAATSKSLYLPELQIVHYGRRV